LSASPFKNFADSPLCAFALERRSSAIFCIVAWNFSGSDDLSALSFPSKSAAGEISDTAAGLEPETAAGTGAFDDCAARAFALVRPLSDPMFMIVSPSVGARE
jgi:hypothetical protein